MKFLEFFGVFRVLRSSWGNRGTQKNSEELAWKRRGHDANTEMCTTWGESRNVGGAREFCMEQTAAYVALIPPKTTTIEGTLISGGFPPRMEGTPEAVAEMEAKRRSEVLVLHIPAAAPVEATAAG